MHESWEACLPGGWAAGAHEQCIPSHQQPVQSSGRMTVTAGTCVSPSTRPRYTRPPMPTATACFPSKLSIAHTHTHLAQVVKLVACCLLWGHGQEQRFHRHGRQRCCTHTLTTPSSTDSEKNKRARTQLTLLCSSTEHPGSSCVLSTNDMMVT